jgi:hypothetical protein
VGKLGGAPIYHVSHSTLRRNRTQDGDHWPVPIRNAIRPSSFTTRSHAKTRASSPWLFSIRPFLVRQELMAGLNLLITGKPGVGKTTLVERIVERLRGSLRLAGFTTTEVLNSAGGRQFPLRRSVLGCLCVSPLCWPKADARKPMVEHFASPTPKAITSRCCLISRSRATGVCRRSSSIQRK